MTTLTFGSLFSGIGGIDLGFERAGMSCRWQVEKDPFCQKVLKKHWPNVGKFEDVRNVGKHNLEPVDLIAGGFPCQPHSLAGKRKGATDDRNLWPEYRRIIGEIKPAWVVGENVPGIVTTMLDDILSDLESLNYQTRTIIIPAAALGAPHIRERVFILAYSNGFRRYGPAAGQSAPDKKRNDPACQPAGETELYAALPSRQDMANPQCFRRQIPESQDRRGDHAPQSERGTQTSGVAGIGWWNVEPGVGRVANGIPNRMDRCRSLGNAVVPQAAEWIGSLILKIANRQIYITE